MSKCLKLLLGCQSSEEAPVLPQDKMKCAPGSGSGSVRVTSGIIKQGKSFKNWSMVEPEVEWI